MPGRISIKTDVFAAHLSKSGNSHADGNVTTSSSISSCSLPWPTAHRPLAMVFPWTHHLQMPLTHMGSFSLREVLSFAASGWRGCKAGEEHQASAQAVCCSGLTTRTDARHPPGHRPTMPGQSRPPPANRIHSIKLKAAGGLRSELALLEGTASAESICRRN